MKKSLFFSLDASLCGYGLFILNNKISNTKIFPKQEAPWVIGNGPGSTWPETGALQLENLSLGYRAGAEPALRDITCAVAPRDKVGIVGRTGAGKSTLTLGLFR